MQTHTTSSTSSRLTSSRLTLSDVVSTVSRFARDEREATAVINHLLSSAKISFAGSRARSDLRRMMVSV
jgi:hypothetical protein